MKYLFQLKIIPKLTKFSRFWPMQDSTVTMPEIHLPKINVRPSAGQNLRMAWVWMRYIHRYQRTSFFSYISSRKNSTISTFFVLSIRMLAACNVWTRPTHPTTNGFPFSGTPSSRFVMNFSAAPCPPNNTVIKAYLHRYSWWVQKEALRVKDAKSVSACKRGFIKFLYFQVRISFPGSVSGGNR